MTSEFESLPRRDLFDWRIGRRDHDQRSLSQAVDGPHSELQMHQVRSFVHDVHISRPDDVQLPVLNFLIPEVPSFKQCFKAVQVLDSFLILGFYLLIASL